MLRWISKVTTREDKIRNEFVRAYDEKRRVSGCKSNKLEINADGIRILFCSPEKGRKGDG